MIAIAPIVQIVVADHVTCTQQSTADAAYGMHGHHGHQAPAAEPASGQDDDLAMAPCCAHGCVVGMSLAADGAAGAPAVTGFIAGWSVTDLTDLTDPYGLRRPPRA
ncbi:hypothetical protein [Maliponia aquimaris]|uniref:hypothetical protein n=1 Tax=Maliponia aquimaris TaxID=1673631 RepID=UPI001596225D|nr:hypothetical protein [Maliponia aquimaris]